MSKKTKSDNPFHQFSDIFKVSDVARIVSDGLISDIRDYVDSGSYVLNAALSGSIFGGYPDNIITALAGEEATGKTFALLNAIKNFLHSRGDKAVVALFESESAYTKEMFINRGIDPNRVQVYPVATIEDFRTQIFRILDGYSKLPEEKKFPLMFGLDSLGNLSTNKEMEDIGNNETKVDMTRPKLIKGTMRAITLKLGLNRCPLIVTNHVYVPIGQMYPSPEMAGGSGLKYSASNIVMLSKSKMKEDGDVIGINVRCKMYKSRTSRQNQEIMTRINYTKGLDRYYGLVELAIEAGIFKKESTRVVLPDGSKQFEKTINDNPEKFWTQDILKQVDEYCQVKFSYGKSDDTIIEEGDDEE